MITNRIPDPYCILESRDDALWRQDKQRQTSWGSNYRCFLCLERSIPSKVTIKRCSRRTSLLFYRFLRDIWARLLFYREVLVFVFVIFFQISANATFSRHLFVAEKKMEIEREGIQKDDKLV